MPVAEEDLLGASATTAIIAGVIGLVIGLVFLLELFLIGGYLFFFTPFPLDVILLGGVLWGTALLQYGRGEQMKEKGLI